MSGGQHIAEAGDFPLRDSAAAQMLRDGLRRLATEKRTSNRQLAKRLGLKQAVVLSHMASGRMPIPIDRALPLADALEIDRRAFLGAVLNQRHPTVDWGVLATRRPAPDEAHHGLANEIEVITGEPLAALTPEQVRVIREVAADRHPARRWLTVHELPLVEAIRERRPAFRYNGLSPAERERLLGML